MKNILKAFKFTLNSIILVAVIISVGIGTICMTNGFENKEKTTMSLILISCLLVAFIVYSIVVLCLYYHLPKNKKSTKKMGVLFFINTHGNNSDFNAIKNKFCERFTELSMAIEKNNLNPVILTQKKTSVIKNIYDKDVQFKLLKRTNCIFGVFMTSTDEGRNTDEYQLQINAMIVHPHLEKNLEEILSNNFNYIFRDLHVSSLSKKNDLKNLQSLSTQLYYICQLIYAVANEYSGYYTGAINLCNEILKKVKNDTSKFYKQLSIILMCEICCCATCITTTQYRDFVYNDTYDKTMVENALLLMSNVIQQLNITDCTINYHLGKAVYKLICGNLIESKGEISLLDKKFGKIKPNQRPWLYSDAFLTACENNSKKFWTIDKKYKQLKNNLTQDPLMMFYFINAYFNHDQENLGIKIAMVLLIKYKNLEYNLLPYTIRTGIVDELKSICCDDFAKHIEKINKEALT